MSTRIFAPNLRWHPITFDRIHSTTIALGRTLRAWEGTPYESGQRFIQRGADCIGGVFGVIDGLDGLDRAQFPSMPQDTSMHDPASARAAVRELVRRYSPCVKVEPLDGVFHVEPGDIVVTGAPGGGPGHVEIVGALPNELWHALPGPGFHQGGWGFLDQQVLFAVYRIQDKHTWSFRETTR